MHRLYILILKCSLCKANVAGTETQNLSLSDCSICTGTALRISLFYLQCRTDDSLAIIMTVHTFGASECLLLTNYYLKLIIMCCMNTFIGNIHHGPYNRSQFIFLQVCQKSMDFNSIFTVRFSNEHNVILRGAIKTFCNSLPQVTSWSKLVVEWQ